MIVSARGSVEHLSNKVDGKDGVGWWGGPYLRMLFSRYDLSVGGRLLGADTDEDKYSYLSWELSARMGIKFMKGELEAAPFISYRQDNYDDKYTVFDSSDREDKRLSAGLAGTWKFADNWSAEVVYTFTDVDSNSVLYDYDQHLISAAVHYLF